MTSSNQSGQGASSAQDEGIDYYQLLNVPYTATFQEITRAYRTSMKRAHPDRHRPERRAAAEEHAKLLNRAFTTLSRGDERRRYDEQIKATKIQSQIMSHYFGGRPPGESADPFGDSLRRKKTRAEQEDQRRADRSAVVSILIVFGGVTLLVVTLLLIWAVVSFAIEAIV